MYKIYYHSLLNFCGHNVLHRKRITIKPEKTYYSSSASRAPSSFCLFASPLEICVTAGELFFHVREALLRLMFEAYLKSSARPSSSASREEHSAAFVAWWSCVCTSHEFSFSTSKSPPNPPKVVFALLFERSIWS